MLKIALKNLATNKIRLGLTMLAIVLGVGFVVSSFVLRDGLKDTFNSLSEAVVAGVDLAVTPSDDSDVRLTPEDLAAIEALPGVRAVSGEISAGDNSIQPVKDDGSTITLQGPPQFAFVYTEDEGINPGTIIEGRAPSADEWMVNSSKAEEHGFVVGRDYDMITPSGRKTATLVGLFDFEGSDLGPTFMIFDDPTLREYALLDDTYDQIQLASDGSVPIPDIQAALETMLNPDPANAEFLVQDQATLAADQQADFNQALNIIGGILLGFAFVALFVSIFIIANTFAITTSQRTRELGLLRAIGATPSQVLRSVVAESIVIGLIASLLGIAAGVGIAYLIRAILNLVNFAIPAFDVVITPWTVLWAFAVGTIVTLVSAVVPAISASRTSPIAAITGQDDVRTRSLARFVIGGIIAALGGALMALGLFGSAETVTGVLAPLGAGAALLFVGITLLSPLVAGPLSLLLGTPISALYGTTGRLSRDNAARNPRRTATTAAALMIGLSLISMALVLGDSFKAEFDKILNTSIQADYMVTSDQADIPDEVVGLIEEDPSFTDVSALKYWAAEFTNEQVDPTATSNENGFYSHGVMALDYSKVDVLFNFQVTEGSLTNIDNNSTAIRDTIAEDLDLGLGDTLTMVLEDDTIADLEVVAVFEEAQISSGVMISFDRFDQVSDQLTSDWIAAKLAPGADVGTADGRFNQLATRYPNLNFDSAAEFRQSFSDQIDQTLNILTVLLGLTIVIALIGIANTLALSVFERTREIGLLRAVGMSRPQTRRMIRWEAAIISAVGAVLGAVLGIALGVLIVTAIPDDLISSFAVPWTRILIMVGVSTVAGLIAALFPAFRASRMNVLDAISTV